MAEENRKLQDLPKCYTKHRKDISSQYRQKESWLTMERVN